MFSWNCMVMTRDGHQIYERGTQNLLNPIKDVIIGEHCWICQHSLILKGAVIPNDSIIAAKSVISKKLEDSHCIYANNKKIKENIDFVL